jgi:hypothetical protein
VSASHPYRRSEEHLRRLRSDRLQQRLVAAFYVIGIAMIAAGAMLYTFTAPPLGGLDWSFIEVYVSIVLVMGGAIVLLARKLP